MSGEPVVVLYVGAHRYALESASAVTLVAQSDDVRATVLVATAGALLAMKLHAIEDRRPSGGHDKRAGDAWDLYRILLDLDRNAAVRNELCQLAPSLRRVVADATERVLVTRATRTVSWLKAGDDRMATISADELRALAHPVIATLGDIARS